MSVVKAIHTFTRAYEDYRLITDDNDLKENHLTVEEYHMVEVVLKELSAIDGSLIPTMNENVKEWFSRHDFLVSESGSGWLIGLKEMQNLKGLEKFKVSFISGKTMKFTERTCFANNEEEAVAFVFTKHGKDFENQLVSVKEVV